MESSASVGYLPDSGMGIYLTFGRYYPPLQLGYLQDYVPILGLMAYPDWAYRSLSDRDGTSADCDPRFR